MIHFISRLALTHFRGNTCALLSAELFNIHALLIKSGSQGI